MKNGCPKTRGACIGACLGGNIKVLKWLHKKGYPWDDRSYTVAAENDNLECLKYLVDNECPKDYGVCRYVARNGHLEVIKYLHKIGGLAYHEWSTYYAAIGGHLEILKYLIENGCRYNKYECIITNKHKEVVDYINSL